MANHTAMDSSSSPEPSNDETEALASGAVGLLRRTVQRFIGEQMTDRAAALTYYAVLSIFPGLIVFAAVLGVVGDPQATTRGVVEIAQELAPGTGVNQVGDLIVSLTESRGTAGVMLVVGLIAGLWSGSGFVGAFMRAANAAYRCETQRAFLVQRPLQLGLTLIAVIVLAIVAWAMVLTGPVIRAVAGPVGIGESTVAVWEVLKWPVIGLLVGALLALLFTVAPNLAERPPLRAVLPGVALGLGVWGVASVAFVAYVANFGSYNKTYGALGGAVSMLVWLWISNCALLLGVTLNAEILATSAAKRADVHEAEAQDESGRSGALPPPEREEDLAH